ncbi:MAG: hypothetical protein Q9204_008772 [Flavoplaca sp. TL-2023a]
MPTVSPASPDIHLSREHHSIWLIQSNRPSRENSTLCRLTPSEDASRPHTANESARPSTAVRPSTISISNPNAAASPRITDIKDVSTQATDTGTQEIAAAAQKTLYIEDIQERLSSIDSQMPKTVACQHGIQNQQCEIRKDILALSKLKGLEIIRQTNRGEEDQKGLQGKGVEQTDRNITIPHPVPPRHITQIDQDHEAIDADFSDCNNYYYHQVDAAGLVTAYLEARGDAALEEKHLAILAIRVSKVLQREERGGIWARVMKLWLNDHHSWCWRR